ncbi:X-ray repair cross-complementing protein 5 [Merluccius polli]|uniref:X-ray repair cross-complementing protein 5 n=1 Tax=Merluccius polli TaxID=89951 RepID=A0AA47P3Q9_MERPO|nr:X-ray repair cross-complementing protein 5 [Merluccius polli]
MDVGSSMSACPDQETPFEQARKVVQKFVQRQVFAENKDELGLVLFGTDATKNQLDHDGQYQNITVHRKLMIPDFELLEEIEHQIHPQSQQADWLDALVVSMDLIQKELPLKKYDRLSIAILTDLNTQANPEQLDVIISNLTGAGITLQFFLPFQVQEEEEDEEGDEGGGDGARGGPGQSGGGKGLSQEQQNGLEILKEVMFTLDEEDGLDEVYTFSGAIKKLSMFKNIDKRPMAWPCQLTIGSALSIRIVGYKAVFSEKLKKMWTTVDAQTSQREDVKRETVYCLDDDNETEVQKDDTIQGFRYGSDIVPFSKVDQDQMKYKHDGKCFAVLGFAKQNMVHRHQFMGNQALKVFAPKDDEHAGVALSSLIHALDELKMMAIVRYTYDRRSNPQVGAAFPCIKRKYECLVYIQLPFMEDLRQFTFPSLENNKKFNPSETQLSAVDSLIDSMMLVKEDEMGEEVDLFKVHHLPNPAFQRHFQVLQHQFAAECEAVGMRISTSKSESMVLNRKRVECTLRVGDEILPQVEEFKYLGVLFTSEGRMEREIDRRIGAASAVMRTLHGSVVVKRELSRKAKLSIYQSIYVPALTYGHELWVMTERTRSRVQAAEMSFLRRVAGLSLRDRVRSSVIREELGVDPLLLRVERSQMRWLGHLVRMPPGRLPGEVFRARPTGRRPRGRPRTRWRDYCLHHRAVHPGSPLPSIEPWLKAALERPLAVAAHCHAPLEELKRTFPLKEVEKKRQLKTSAQVFGKGPEEPDAKKSKADEEDDYNLADISEGTVTSVGSVDPARDYRCLIKQKSLPFGEVCQQLTRRIEQLLLIGNKNTHCYMKCITCVQAFREESVKLGNADLYNVYIQTLKRSIPSRGLQVFWDLLVQDAITLISKDEVEASSVSKSEANQFLVTEEKKEEAAAAAASAEEDAGDLDDLRLKKLESDKSVGLKTASWSPIASLTRTSWSTSLPVAITVVTTCALRMALTASSMFCVSATPSVMNTNDTSALRLLWRVPPLDRTLLMACRMAGVTLEAVSR